MTWFTGIIVYLLVWWMTLFTVLPLWVKRSETHEADIDSGAPENSHIKRKFILTSILSVFIWIIIYILIEMKLIDFHAISMMMFEEDYR